MLWKVQVCSGRFECIVEGFARGVEDGRGVDNPCGSPPGRFCQNRQNHWKWLLNELVNFGSQAHLGDSRSTVSGARVEVLPRKGEVPGYVGGIESILTVRKVRWAETWDLAPAPAPLSK